MTSRIQFSVVIPFYNSEKTIRDAVNSILSQTYKNFEIILVDNNSNDSSSIIAKELCEADNRVCLITEQEQGISYALNTGVRNSSGKYIARMDADDIAKSDWFDNAISYISLNPEIGFFSFDYIKLNQQGEVQERVCHPTKHETLFPLLLTCSPFCHPGSIISRKILIETPYKNVKAEDHNLWCRLIVKHTSGNTGKVAIFYRNNENSLSNINSKKIRRSVLFNSFLLLIKAPLRSAKYINRVDIEDLRRFETLPLNRIKFLKKIFRGRKNA